LITTALLLLKKNYLTSDDIRHGLLAFTLSARDQKTEFIPLKYEKIVKCLRVLNKTMSEAILNRWYEFCKTNLECHTSTRLFVERDIKDPLRSTNANSNIRSNNAN
jgi:adenylate kinase family enzyme